MYQKTSDFLKVKFCTEMLLLHGRKIIIYISLNICSFHCRKQSVDLPPNFQHCSLKGRPFTPSLDLSIHNVQGIDVWAPKGPKPFGKAGTYSRKYLLLSYSTPLVRAPFSISTPYQTVCPLFTRLPH